MQDFVGGPWDLAGYDLLQWHGALNLLPRSQHVLTLKTNLASLENLVTILTSEYETELGREPSLPSRSVNENEGAVEVSGPSATIRVRRTLIPPSRLSNPATGPPAPAEPRASQRRALNRIANFVREALRKTKTPSRTRQDGVLMANLEGYFVGTVWIVCRIRLAIL